MKNLLTKTAGMLFILVLLGTSACRSTKTSERGAISEPKLGASPDPGSVLFKLETVNGDASGARQWIASYTSRGKTAFFRIELGKPQGDINKSDAILFGSGRFLSDPKSDSSTMLSDLQRALEAKKLPKDIKREASIPLTYAILGEHQSRFEDGSFGSKPPGNWSSMKIFIQTGDEESEVFLNLDPADKQGEFAIKDSDYGDAILTKLAAVL